MQFKSERRVGIYEGSGILQNIIQLESIIRYESDALSDDTKLRKEVKKFMEIIVDLLKDGVEVDDSLANDIPFSYYNV
ncbi:3171_t:CDS:2 [Diversispora eburnea]|uniref:3171_t:CDS:1 n=1 Tax=Diversispora eburnea TaxID=1213867 RepID=A0A9N9FU34_9GLOM|nr:3171_t:CDS:2 [Diversispora eburnea]